MTRPEIYEIAKKFFSMPQAETDRYLDRFVLRPQGAVHVDFAPNVTKEQREAYMQEHFRPSARREDNIRVQYILRLIEKYCEPFIEVSDEKLRRKVGKVILANLNYLTFGDEPAKSTYYRLDKLFESIVAHKINPYKIIYCSVLTDGNLRTDFENNTKGYDKNRDFDNIYKALKSTLSLSDEETVVLFEKCSTLISKVSADRIPKVYNFIYSLNVGKDECYARLFEEAEVAEILKINPSLFTVSREKMLNALRYVERKVEQQLENNLLPLHSNQTLNFVANKRQLLRNWIKNNTSLLSINSDGMLAKEHFISTQVYPYVHKSYKSAFSKSIRGAFGDRITMALVSQVPIEKFKRNALRNIETLQVVASPITLGDYIFKNPLVLAMKFEDLQLLMSKICENEETKEKNLERFFGFGRTLFASNVDFKVDEIYEKLLNDKYLIPLDVERLSGMDYVLKFCEIFMADDHAIAIEIEDLIKQKRERTERGEKALRKRIRFSGEQLVELPKFIKTDDLTLAKKKELILAYAQDIRSLNECRFRLANADSYLAVRRIELENSTKIENLLNKLRDIFEQKRFNLGKKYQNTDQLFEKMMDYLGNCFDDKEPISEIFSREVAERYSTIMKEEFDGKISEQGSFFERDVIIEGMSPTLIGPLRELTKQVEMGDDETKVKHIVFEKK